MVDFFFRMGKIRTCHGKNLLKQRWVVKSIKMVECGVG
jgi:hypothetical protein